MTTWSLQMTSPEEFTPAAGPGAPDGVTIARAEVPAPEFSRFLYTAVGGDLHWTDRLPWTYTRWQEFLRRPGVETWVLHEHGTPAGYIELEAQPEATVEITYFGLLPAFRGRRLGGLLLSFGTARAWDLAERWPELAPTRRVWVHTCSKDGPHALANYERRGFKVFDIRTEDEPQAPTPGPWPGAFQGSAG